MIARSTVKVILPLACSWVRRQEALIIAKGRPLNRSQMADAKRIGIKHPEKIRILLVEKIPMPVRPLSSLGMKLGLLARGTIGMALRYGIFVQAGHANDRRLLLHELAHTLQYERLGGIRPFLQCYLLECLTAGYPFGAMEEEARQIAAQILSAPSS
jgi:hypothetical protein